MDETVRAWPNVFTPATLADWWECSERHVRNLIEQGDLPAFRLGGKLLRIRPEDVEAFDCRSGAARQQEHAPETQAPVGRRPAATPLTRTRITTLRKSAARPLSEPR
jgi:excisionase family DNA binding protein